MIEYIVIVLIAILSVGIYGNYNDWSQSNYLKFIFSILLSFGAGAIGSIFTISGLEPWYAGLAKPSFAPSGEIISIIWILLYAVMGISLYLILTHDLGEKKVKIAIVAFMVQLGFNALWSYLFFGLQSLFLGLVGIFVLWVAIGFTIFLFDRVSKNAAYLLLPYILWVSIALVLNISLYILN